MFSKLSRPYHSPTHYSRKKVVSFHVQISDAVAESLRRGRLCLTLGGDHSLAIGSIFGHSIVKPDIGVIWVDAHGDINPPLKSLSGNAHGMTLAFLMHELHDQVPDDLPEFKWVKPW